MLLFDLSPIRVYIAPIAVSAATAPQSRRAVERSAVASLLKEAFPALPSCSIAHHPDGAPYLALPSSASPSLSSLSSASSPSVHHVGNLLWSERSEDIPSSPSSLPPAPSLPFEISITHCREAALLAIAPRGIRLGIDADSLNRQAQLRRIAPRFLSPSQLQAIESSLFQSGQSATTQAIKSPADRDLLLLQAWTIKEALYKAARHSGLELAAIPLPSSLPILNLPETKAETPGPASIGTPAAAPIEAIFKATESQVSLDGIPYHLLSLHPTSFPILVSLAFSHLEIHD